MGSALQQSVLYNKSLNNKNGHTDNMYSSSETTGMVSLSVNKKVIENTKYSGVDDSASTNQTCGVVILPGGIKGADESQIDLNKTTLMVMLGLVHQINQKCLL